MTKERMSRCEVHSFVYLLQTGLGSDWDVNVYKQKDPPTNDYKVVVRRIGSDQHEDLIDAEDMYAFITNQAYNQYANSPAGTLAELEVQQQ